VALRDIGRLPEAIAVLEEAHARRPADADILYALALYSLDAGDRDAASGYARELNRLQPGNPQARALLQRLAP
jgi:tetratricopeptide (TPR) repeat protein